MCNFAHPAGARSVVPQLPAALPQIPSAPPRSDAAPSPRAPVAQPAPESDQKGGPVSADGAPAAAPAAARPPQVVAPPVPQAPPTDPSAPARLVPAVEVQDAAVDACVDVRSESTQAGPESESLACVPVKLWPFSVNSDESKALCKSDVGMPDETLARLPLFGYHYEVLRALRRYCRLSNGGVFFARDPFEEMRASGPGCVIVVDNHHDFADAVAACGDGDFDDVLWIGPSLAKDSVTHPLWAAVPGDSGTILVERTGGRMFCELPPPDVFDNVVLDTGCVTIWSYRGFRRDHALLNPIGSAAINTALEGRSVRGAFLVGTSADVNIELLRAVEIGGWFLALNLDHSIRFVVPNSWVIAAQQFFMGAPERTPDNFRKCVAQVSSVAARLVMNGNERYSVPLVYAAVYAAYVDVQLQYSVLQQAWRAPQVTAFNDALLGRRHLQVHWWTFYLIALVAIGFIWAIYFSVGDFTDPGEVRWWWLASAAVLTLACLCSSVFALSYTHGTMRAARLPVDKRVIHPWDSASSAIALGDYVQGFTTPMPPLVETGAPFFVKIAGRVHDRVLDVAKPKPAMCRTGMRLGGVLPQAPSHDTPTTLTALSRLLKVDDEFIDNSNFPPGWALRATFLVRDFLRQIGIDYSEMDRVPNEDEVRAYLSEYVPRVGRHRGQYVSDVVLGKRPMVGTKRCVALWELAWDDPLFSGSEYFVKSEVLFPRDDPRPRGIENDNPYRLILMGRLETVLSKQAKRHFSWENHLANKFVWGAGRSAKYLADSLGPDVYDDALGKVSFDHSAFDSTAHPMLMRAIFAGFGTDPRSPFVSFLLRSVGHRIAVRVAGVNRLTACCDGKVRTGSAWTSFGNTLLHYVSQRLAFEELGVWDRVKWFAGASDDGLHCSYDRDPVYFYQVATVLKRQVGLKLDPITFGTGAAVDFLSSRWWRAADPATGRDCFAFTVNPFRRLCKWGWQVDVPYGLHQERGRAMRLSTRAATHGCPLFDVLWAKPGWSKSLVGPVRYSLSDDEQYKPYMQRDEGPAVNECTTTPAAAVEFHRVYGISVSQASLLLGDDPCGDVNADFSVQIEIDMHKCPPVPRPRPAPPIDAQINVVRGPFRAVGDAVLRFVNFVRSRGAGYQPVPDAVPPPPVVELERVEVQPNRQPNRRAGPRARLLLPSVLFMLMCVVMSCVDVATAGDTARPATSVQRYAFSTMDEVWGKRLRPPPWRSLCNPVGVGVPTPQGATGVAEPGSCNTTMSTKSKQNQKKKMSKPAARPKPKRINLREVVSQVAATNDRMAAYQLLNCREAIERGDMVDAPVSDASAVHVFATTTTVNVANINRTDAMNSQVRIVLTPSPQQHIRVGKTFNNSNEMTGVDTYNCEGYASLSTNFQDLRCAAMCAVVKYTGLSEKKNGALSYVNVNPVADCYVSSPTLGAWEGFQGSPLDETHYLYASWYPMQPEIDHAFQSTTAYAGAEATATVIDGLFAPVATGPILLEVQVYAIWAARIHASVGVFFHPRMYSCSTERFEEEIQTALVKLPLYSQGRCMRKDDGLGDSVKGAYDGIKGVFDSGKSISERFGSAVDAVRSIGAIGSFFGGLFGAEETAYRRLLALNEEQLKLLRDALHESVDPKFYEMVCERWRFDRLKGRSRRTPTTFVQEHLVGYYGRLAPKGLAQCEPEDERDGVIVRDATRGRDVARVDSIDPAALRLPALRRQ